MNKEAGIFSGIQNLGQRAMGMFRRPMPKPDMSWAHTRTGTGPIPNQGMAMHTPPGSFARIPRQMPPPQGMSMRTKGMLGIGATAAGSAGLGYALGRSQQQPQEQAMPQQQYLMPYMSMQQPQFLPPAEPQYKFASEDLYAHAERIFGSDKLEAIRSAGMHKVAARLEYHANGRDVDQIDLPTAIALIGERAFTKRAQHRMIDNGIAAYNCLKGK